ncbi:helix-turn-helix domain-containing protein [Chryseobacterium taiwanense]|uniref:helix-turn-helix domain-containing protein n=1 Tax=Chryseobacterium taiwanense TaxID=363331 RepID=UPI00069259C6|nr:helix-turn-helix domain-containing protein [Chryseobacterium taiwanense]
MKKRSGTSMYDDELLNTILAVFEEILNTLKENQTHDSQYYDSADVKRLLNISDSTLFRIRKSQNIPYVKIGRKIFYPKSFFKDILKK